MSNLTISNKTVHIGQSKSFVIVTVCFPFSYNRFALSRHQSGTPVAVFTHEDVPMMNLQVKWGQQWIQAPTAVMNGFYGRYK